ncbi:2,3,4,5-tetrahydropyridine-2,6-dicarboxylate N-succinyltransferase [Myxococcus sp. CA051A]|uniref:2,3,4,5-tetrahydropyridine-2,6-dicarboxylate N-succinyltransferase n=1 Tax=unclassified Myxococcus TaxID=2648731 RepID=UPI00157AB8A8|nr:MULTISPECIES: 2,3,4,5-tetrahydropyridine-2,6-dicarboxylate N-succinyltransferase [unclassified Myxococcus]NTX11350.1 2,3,4,5-tetrahydropyridine-2,6-dicarboxylate N-succinyltransferase [Myxococcus sp. CA056]NTX55238.1 2,3,4,5-tetrahydropyridine-2,6-dicarboxylate N-succinyltransferase [Myxococcus sp. CA039A]NTX60622.1 2,3,4,5-tetrahydropyridine-2,6-dicarboxylate N-succinyltransferase [Myxococcus sp. CA051A]
MPPIDELAQKVSAAFADRTKLKDPDVVSAVRETVARLDAGELRVAEKGAEGWKVHAWVKEAILLFFAVSEMKVMEVGPFEFHDKVPLKKGLDKAGVRVVPPGTVRYGAFVERGAVVMPGYVNIGARVGAGTMVDTWATVGSCAQVGSDVHLSGGVGLGGVLEPPTASPVIIEDRAFLGSRCIVVEGVVVEEEAVLGANVVLTASTQIIDVTGPEERVYKGRVPARSVVIPGMREKQFPAGKFMVPCALIIGQRTQSTDKKTSLNSALRDFAVPV